MRCFMGIGLLEIGASVCELAIISIPARGVKVRPRNSCLGVGMGSTLPTGGWIRRVSDLRGMPREADRAGPYATEAGEPRQDRKVATVTDAFRAP